MNATAYSNYPDPRDASNRVWDGPLNEPILYCSYSLVDEANRPGVCVYHPDRPKEWIVTDETVAAPRHRLR